MQIGEGEREGGSERDLGEKETEERREKERDGGDTHTHTHARTHTHTHTPNFGFPVWMAKIGYSKPPDLLRGMSL